MLKTIFFNPIYNVYVVLVNIIPGHDLGLAIILLTVLFKLAIYPLYRQAILTSLRLKEINPQLEELKKRYKDDKTLQAKKMMELYKSNNINPLSGFWVIIVQIPIFLTLFYVFRGDITAHFSSLYSFVPAPTVFNKLFLGIFDLSANKNYLFAVLTGLTQYYQTKLTLPAPSPAPINGGERSFADDFGRSMNTQMLYVMPVIIVFVSATVPAAVCLYWIASNTMSIVLELVYRKKK